MAASYEADVLGDMLQSMLGEDSIDTAGLIFIKANIHFHKEEYQEAMNMYQSFTSGEQLLHAPDEDISDLHL